MSRPTLAIFKDHRDPDSALALARRLCDAGRDGEAKAAYVAILQRDPANLEALIELGCLTYRSGHRSAAKTAFEQAVHCHPQSTVARINLGNLLHEDGDDVAARQHFEVALARDSRSRDAHRGLAQALTRLGETNVAGFHWRHSFVGQAVAVQKNRAPVSAPRVLVLVSVEGGNIPTRPILDDRHFAVTVLYAEYHETALPLPPHELIFNAIGDADLCAEALGCADEIIARSQAPVVNRPSSVRETSRARNALRLAGIPVARVPKVETVHRSEATEHNWQYPLLLRSPGFHTGRHFVRVERRADLDAALSELPGEELLAIEYLDARGADGMARKYRAMFIGGAIYPVHLAISKDWKVHYFSADMAANAGHREEERRFLEDMSAVLGSRAMDALTAIGEALALDYAGIDFALDAEGRLIVFEANATMVLAPPPPDGMWDYRRTAIGSATSAVDEMLRSRARR
jgi:tetratricopeptide (TPR) repeat protein